MVNDITNTFIQAPNVIKDGGDRVIMKITGVLVDIILEKNPVRYKYTRMAKGWYT